MSLKKRKQEWNNRIASVRNIPETNERARQLNKRIDNHVPHPGKDNSWRVYLLTFPIR